MTEKEAIQKIIKDTKTKKYAICKRLGRNKNHLHIVLKPGRSIRFTTVYKILDALGYEVIFRKRGYVRLMDGEILIDEVDDEDNK